MAHQIYLRQFANLRASWRGTNTGSMSGTKQGLGSPPVPLIICSKPVEVQGPLNLILLLNSLFVPLLYLMLCLATKGHIIL